MAFHMKYFQLPLSLLLLSLLAGCAAEKESEEEEAHHIPAHTPADFEKALSRIETLTNHLRDGSELADKPLEVTPQEELRDLVRWLPKLAAESDLNEADWNVVDQSTIAIIDRLWTPGKPPQDLFQDRALLDQVAALPQKLSEVRKHFAELQVPEPEDISDSEIPAESGTLETETKSETK
jgi:hypothetical protein